MIFLFALSMIIYPAYVLQFYYDDVVAILDYVGIRFQCGNVYMLNKQPTVPGILSVKCPNAGFATYRLYEC